MEECRTYDAAIIGGGVVGCAVLRELTSRGLHCVLCETNSQLVSQASSGIDVSLFLGTHALGLAK